MIKSRLNAKLERIVEISKRYGARKVILFGSFLEDALKANDIDIAISGIPDKDFFKYYGQISMEIDDVDVVDLNDLPEHFYQRVMSKGRVLYDRKN